MHCDSEHTLDNRSRDGGPMRGKCDFSAFDMLKSTEKDSNGQYLDTSIEGLELHKKKGQPTIE